MLRLIFNKDSFIQNRIPKNIKNNYNYENSLTPVKLIHKDKKITKNRSLNLTKTKLIKRDKNKFVDNPHKSELKNNQKNLKFELLNKTNNKNSRNFEPYIDIFTKSNNYMTYNTNNTNNSLSYMTNLKTTIDSNITKTINNQNLKEKENKMNNKDNSSLIDSKSITFLSSSPIEMRSINPNSQINNNNQNNKDINTYKLIKRPKIKIPKSKSSIYKNAKNKKLAKYLFYNQNKANFEYSNINNSNIHTNNSNKTFAFPNRINILINLQNDLLNPMRKNNEIKFRDSLSLNKKINKIEESIHFISQKQKTIDNNKILIKKSKLKNIFMLLENQKESNNYKNKIEKENEEIEKIKEKIKKLKDKTVIMNNETMGFKTEIIENKAEISEIKEKIEKIINDKKMANSMIILLHRRIIDIKKRINERDERNLYLDKTFYELGVKYQQDGNNINMSSLEK
jgi:hypothetical protein